MDIDHHTMDRKAKDTEQHTKELSTKEKESDDFQVEKEIRTLHRITTGRRTPNAFDAVQWDIGIMIRNAH